MGEDLVRDEGREAPRGKWEMPLSTKVEENVLEHGPEYCWTQCSGLLK